MSFTPVKQARIAVEIVSQLKAAILSGRFKPGERLPTERELTEQFQVSRVVVREAVRELEIKGLVRILQGPTGGAYVTDLSLDHLNNAFLDLFLYNRVSVAELIQARRLIECEIVRLAAARIDASCVRRLQAALATERQAGASHAALVSNRLTFHHLLAEACGNRLLQATASALLRLTGEVILEVKPVKKVIHRQEEHAAILRAVLDQDGAAAERAMQQHLESMGRQLARLEGTYRKRRGLAT
jgi:GntR family transcriptional regulator, transcriptional repressor for pyruvate dehydrogenase complex